MDVNAQETSALRLYGQALWRRRYEFFTTAGLVLLAMTLYTQRQPKSYESSLLLLVGSQQKPQVVSQDQPNVESKETSGELETEVQLLQTLPLISQATDALHKQYPTLDPQMLAEDLAVQQIGKSGIISITYQDSDPERLVKVLNQLGETYVEFSLTNRRSQVTNAIRFIEQKLPSAQQSLAEQSQQLASFRKQNNFDNPNEVGSTLTKALVELGNEERTTMTEFQQTLALYNTLEQRLDLLPPDHALAIASLSQDPIYLGLLQSYQEAEQQYSLERLRFGENAPPLQRLRQRRDQLSQLLANQVQQVLGKNVNSAGVQRLNALQIAQVGQLLEAESNLRVQQAHLVGLQATRQQLEQTFKAIPDLQQAYDDLTRQVQISSDNVTQLLSKLEEFRILEAQQSPTWQVIQPPYPPSKPVSPNVKLNLMVSSVLALLLGALVVYVREQLDKRLRSVSSVKGMLPLQTLSSIPRTDETLLHLNAFPADHSSEQYYIDSVLRLQWLYFQAAVQHLLFTLRSNGVTDTLKAIGFTSSTSQEGKTITVRHLGICAAELGHRVLLIDGDLRKPELHLGFKASNVRGLSSIIGDSIPWQEVVQETSQTGLHLLAAGPTPSNPVALLDSAKMRQLLVQVRDHYDLILMDLPPIIGLADALAAANHLDSLVLLVGLNHADRETLSLSLESLSYAHSQPLGIVCNMAQVSEISRSTYLRNAGLGEEHHPSLQNQFVQRMIGHLSQWNDRK